MKIESHPSPHFSSRGTHKPRLIVLHADAGKTDLGTISWVKDPKSKISYHFYVGRDGTVYQFVKETENAWHAGLSKWKGMEIGKTVNPISIGVAFANDGLEAYRDEQYKAGAELLKELTKRHGIEWEGVVTHAQISPGRKRDPYDHFSMATLKKLYDAE